MNKEVSFVLDHDGFLTDPEKTHHVYTRVFENQFSGATGIPKRVIHDHMEAARKEIKARPKIYAWEKEGYKVAPATVDTYVLNSVAAEMAIITMRDSGEKGFPTDPTEAKKFVEGLYFASYPQVKPFYRPETARTIKELHPLGKLVIVSNSAATHLLAKIHPFLEKNHIPEDAVEVLGDAQKFIITPEWDKVDKLTHFPGLARPVLLRRGHYGGVILSLGQDPFIVAGDSGEMDLATPKALGFRTLLLQTPFSVPWELNAFENVTSLDGVTGRIIREMGK